MTSNVVNLFATDDIPLMLRNMADRIEAGEEGVLDAMVAFTLDEHGNVTGYGWGADIDALRMLGILRLLDTYWLHEVMGA
jgi:hypothetical protein